MVKEAANEQEFTGALSTAASAGKAILVDFHAQWCGPCKMIAPKLAEFEHKYTNVMFIKVDVDELDEVAQEWNINAMPTFIVIKDKKEVERLTGASAEKLEALIAKYN